MKKLLSIFLVVLLLLSTSGCKPISQEALKVKPEEKDPGQKIHEFLKLLEEEKLFSGFVMITDGNELLYSQGYGMADFENQIPHTHTTRYRIGSITKQFVAVAILQLYEQGKLDLSDKLSKFIPNFPNSDKITIEQMLNHTSGLKMDISEFDIKRIRPGSKVPKEDIEATSDTELSFKPGTGFSYSSLGYTLLGYVVEAIFGQTLDAYMEENIFKPLGMKDSGFTTSDDIENMAVGYVAGNLERAEVSEYVKSLGALGSGNMYSTVVDLYIWNRAVGNEQFLSKETWNKAFTPNSAGYGYGWFINTQPSGERVYSHKGMSPGFSSYVVKNDNGFEIIVLSNYRLADLDDVMMEITSNLMVDTQTEGN